MSGTDITSSPRVWLGSAIAVAAATGYALANTSATVAYGGGSNALTVAGTRFLVPTVALMIWLRLSGLPLVLPKREGSIAALLGFLTALYTWALLNSFNSIPFAVAVLIFYLFPLLAAAMVATLGWQKFSWKTGAGILLALCGLALALDVQGGRVNAAGVLLAFLAAAGLAVVIAVSSRLLGKSDARPVTFYMASVAAAVLLMLCVASGSLALPQTQAGWAGLIAAAAFYGFAMIAFFIALSMIGPVRASLLSYAEAVISAWLGAVVLGQAATPLQMAGIALVILALVGTTLAR